MCGVSLAGQTFSCLAWTLDFPKCSGLEITHVTQRSNIKESSNKKLTFKE